MNMQTFAADLGVSRTTVSLVLTGRADKYRISPETQKRILRKSKEVGFRPNFFASALNLKKTGVVGVVFPNVFETFMNEIVRGMEDVLYPAGQAMMLSTSHFDREVEERNLEQLVYRGVDGLVIACNAPFKGFPYSYDHIAGLARGGMPLVFVDRCPPGVSAPRVVQDDHFGAYEACRHLAAAGCRTIGYLSLDIDISSISERRRGYEDALRDCGLPLEDYHTILLHERAPQSRDLADALAELHRRKRLPDGFLVTTNGIAYKALSVLSSLGLTVNHDIRIARFGSDPACHASGMSSVVQPHQEMGRAAAGLLEKIVSGRAPARTPREITIKPAFMPADA